MVDGNKEDDAYRVQSSKGIIKAIPRSCQCRDWLSKRMPCRHIFALRRLENLSLFDKTLLNEHFTKDYYLTNQRLLRDCFKSKQIVDCNETNSIENNMEKLRMSAFIKTARPKVLSYPKKRADVNIGDSPYAIIADEATDVSVTKFMGLCIRFFCKGRRTFVTDFLGIVEVVSCTGQNLALALIEYLETIGLPLNQLHSIGTDGVSAMCGSQNSFFTHLRDRGPHLQLVKCICHSLDKSAQYAYQTIPDKVTYLVKETYNWFAHSSIRLHAYATFFKVNKTLVF